jgi:hypothetical protein
MKLSNALAIFCLLAATANAATRTRVLKDTTTLIALELTPQTVFCTARGYTSIQLKVSVPELDDLAHFDHRVVGENLPCITGGACDDAFQPGGIIRPDERFAIVPMQVVLTENLTINDEARTCFRSLHERVTSTIRDKPFSHVKGSAAVQVDYEKCLASPQS